MPRTEPSIANYDARTADEITQRLRKLSQADLTKLEAHEKQGQKRSTVLKAIAALRGDPPWSGYDDLEVEEVNEALKQRDAKSAARVLDYERSHKGRRTVIEFAKRRQEATDDGSSASSAPKGGKERPKAQSRTRRTKPSQQLSRSPTAGSGASKRSAPKRSSASRSRGSSAPKAAPSKTRPQNKSSRSAGSPTRARSTGRTRNSASPTPHASDSPAKDGRGSAGTAALVGGALLTVAGGGLAVARGSQLKLHERKRVLGVPVPPRTAFGKVAKVVAAASRPIAAAKRLLP